MKVWYLAGAARTTEVRLCGHSRTFFLDEVGLAVQMPDHAPPGTPSASPHTAVGPPSTHAHAHRVNACEIT